MVGIKEELSGMDLDDNSRHIWRAADRKGIMRRQKEPIKHKIAKVREGSIAEELQIEPGDKLVSIDEMPVEDVFDYHYLINEEYLTVVIEKPDGEEWELEIEKEYEEDLGIEFENALLDDYRSCRNKCIFCFIDQLPKGMRSTLYFKDDDSRLSFLQGNYVTLTNMSDHDIDRIIRYHLEPINISFHTMNPELRVKMLNNRFAGDIFPKVQRLHEAGVEMNGQIVLCRGINDGEELDYSIQQFEQYLPELKSVSVVPVGLSRHRKGLYPLEPFTREDAEAVLCQIERWQDYYYKKYGTHLVHAGDEWYILAGREVPEADSYDGYLQLENGVGMVRLLLDECDEYLKELRENQELTGLQGQAGRGMEEAEPQSLAGKRMGDASRRSVALATGKLAGPYLRRICDKIEEQFPWIECKVYEIENRFFGEMITVSGLLTGQDLLAQLTGKELGDALLLPCNMLRSGEEVFLDDMTVGELEKALQTQTLIVKSSGRDLIDTILGWC